MFSTVIMYMLEITQLSHLLADLCLDSAGDTGVTHTKQATSRCAGSEPVTTSQPLHQGLEMDLQVNRRVLLRDLTQGLHSLISDDCLFHRCKALQWWLQNKNTELSNQIDDVFDPRN